MASDGEVVKELDLENICKISEQDSDEEDSLSKSQSNSSILSEDIQDSEKLDTFQPQTQ